ncbi:hypothetical protein P692DRAFT_201894793 [Suillus brevipes Sb2]|nr:hypothetical protein P692DRAFT_201894793 [Suillus brevipes Sb2]
MLNTTSTFLSIPSNPHQYPLMSGWDQFSQSSAGPWEKLSRVAVLGAEYDSPERQPHPKCLEGTRVDLLQFIHGLLDKREKSQIVWLHGTAGVGKSAVAFTVAERMKGLKVREETNVETRLAGTFFFSRKHTKRSTTGHFFATLAYQLASNFPSVKNDVNEAILENPAVLDSSKSLRDQMKALFLRPLRRLCLQSRLCECPPPVFVVDALDECKPETVADLISLLGQALRDPDLPVIHILLTSRSEEHIRKAIQKEEMRTLMCEIPVNTSGDGVAATISLDGEDVDNDIYLFLQYSFTELRSRHPDFPQPTGDELTRLANRAGRRFIVASTMMKFIDDGYNDPRDRLELMLELTHELLPGTEVFKLYNCILSTCSDPNRAYQHLSIVAALADPLPILQISKLLGPGQGDDIATVLVQLRSFMDIPADSSQPVNIYHLSIRDYVSDFSNCSLPRVQSITPPHSLLAYSSFRLMIRDMPERTALMDALLELKSQNQAIEPHDPRSLQQTLAFIVEPPAPLHTQCGEDYLRTQEGEDWPQTHVGDTWLQTERWRGWLQSGPGWLWTQRRRQVAGDPGEYIPLETWSGTDSLETISGKGWLQTKTGREWLQTQTKSERLWLQTNDGREWLQNQYGRKWLQTPRGQAWQLTPAASVWVTMEDFSHTLETISECAIVPQLHLPPAFQAIQEFKSLPDYLMLPVFLALRPQDHSTSASLQDCPDIEVIRAMAAFTIFANETRDQSRTASDALKYACQNWVFHLSRAPSPTDTNFNRAFKVFWDRHLLSWLERQWCLKGLRSCLLALSEGQKLAQERLIEVTGSS